MSLGHCVWMQDFSWASRVHRPSCAGAFARQGKAPQTTRCPFRKFGASRTSCPRRRASSPWGGGPLDSRFRGNDAKP